MFNEDAVEELVGESGWELGGDVGQLLSPERVGEVTWAVQVEYAGYWTRDSEALIMAVTSQSFCLLFISN